MGAGASKYKGRDLVELWNAVLRKSVYSAFWYIKIIIDSAPVSTSLTGEHWQPAQLQLICLLFFHV